MAAVKVLPANSESAVDDSHDELDLPQQVVSLIMRGGKSKAQGLLGGDKRYRQLRRGFDGRATWPRPSTPMRRALESVPMYAVVIPPMRLYDMISNSCQVQSLRGGGQETDVLRRD